MKAVTLDETKRKEMRTPDNYLLYSTYFGEALAVHSGPQVFLIEMPNAGSTVHPHFHDVDQFQVIVKGEGRLGQNAAEPIAFHYADAFTPYGPIVGGDAGLSFLTIRKACAAGYYPMPESRKLILGKVGRNIVGKFAIDQRLPAEGDVVRESLLETDDRVKVVGMRLGPNARAKGEATDAGDQYYLVCAGGLVHAGKLLPSMTLFHVEAGEATATFVAGPNGAEILLTQMPIASGRPGSDPEELAKRQILYKLPEGISVES